MAKKCKECPEKKEITDVKAREERKYSFPTLWLTVMAKSLEEAEKKIKALTKYQNKSI